MTKKQYGRNPGDFNRCIKIPYKNFLCYSLFPINKTICHFPVLAKNITGNVFKMICKSSQGVILLI